MSGAVSDLERLLAPRTRDGAVGPRIFDAALPDDRSQLVELARSERVAEVCDTLKAQLAELVETRRPAEKLSATELAAAVAELLGPEPAHSGRWVFYPWSGRLVHVLAERDFAELRTSRNRNKITQQEQARLAGLRIGIVGLSVGQATALTLALEGFGSLFRLADFDALSLSNLNRLRAGVHELGQNKALITARAIWELNPYAKIELFSDGVNEGNLQQFFRGESKLDVLFEECDDLAMKIRLREVARELGIPVLMETSDRGMLDVERFDREPTRPLLHGLAGELDASRLSGLSAHEKVPIIVAMVGEVSPRAAASLVDIDATLKTWPQLASAVSLGAALNTDALRRLALGHFTRSGRFYVDLEQLVADDAKLGPAPAPHGQRARPPRSGNARAFSASDTLQQGPLAANELETLVRWAALAPSGGNCQPWRFEYDERACVLACFHASERSSSFLDFEHRAAHLALGAALENLRLAALSLRLAAEFELWPSGSGPLVARVRFRRAAAAPSAEDAQLISAVEQRLTNRKLGERSALPSGFAQRLLDSAQRSGARLDLVEDSEAISAIAEAVAKAERLRVLNPALHREMMSEVRWSPEEAERTHDGLELATLELSAADRAGLAMLRRPEVAAALREVDGGVGLKKGVYKAFAASSALGFLRFPGDRSLRGYLLGGQALERLWLLATANGVALQPMTALLYLLARMESEGDASLSANERKELGACRRLLDAEFAADDGAEIMLFRLFRAGPPTARSLRRPLDEILTIV